MNLNNLFDVEIEDLKELFVNDSSKCFYIPAYQRPYSWETEQVNRVWEDFKYGIDELSRVDDYVSFLGSIITIHDISHVSISPIVKNEVPAKVLLIIDGQQRLTSLLLLIIAIEDSIFSRLNKKSIDEMGAVITEVLGNSSNSYKSEKSSSLHDKKLYPKVIRAYTDQWSYSDKEKYQSPIAAFLNAYIEHRVQNEKKGSYSSFIPSKQLSTDEVSFNKIYKNFRQFRKLIDDYIGKAENYQSHDNLINNARKLSLTKELLLTFKEKHNTDENNKKIFLLSLIMRYIFQRVFISHIKAKKEEYAFEMFDSLNTNGDPLTAYETFKPKVIESVTLENYGNSPEKYNVDKIDSFLDFNTKSRDKISTQLVTSFALCETGEKLTNKLRDQRIYLRASYESCEDKIAYIDNMRAVTEFMHIWNESTELNKWRHCTEQSVIDSIEFDDEALICLQFLSKMNHTIAIPLLSRFLRDNQSELSEALKAVTAYAVLWRSVRAKTEGIDNTYRSLMKNGVDLCVTRGKDGIEEPTGSVDSFCRALAGCVNVTDLKKAFRFYLYNQSSKIATDSVQIYQKEQWLNKLVNIPVYENNKNVAKFMLITAFDNAVSIPNSAGLLQKARHGVIRTLDRRYDDKLFQTIEHISPQSKGYEGVSEEKAHTLGNLTLLPDINNKSASNSSLKTKQYIYEALSRKTKDEQQRVIDEYGRFSENTKKILKQTEYLPFCESLTSLTSWDDNMIDERTRNLGEMIWNKLAVGWLDFDE